MALDKLINVEEISEPDFIISLNEIIKYHMRELRKCYEMIAELNTYISYDYRVRYFGSSDGDVSYRAETKPELGFRKNKD
jgi:hypothetical protein